MKHDSLGLVFGALFPLFGQPFHCLQEREGLLKDGLLFVIFYRDTFTEILLLITIVLLSLIAIIVLHIVNDNVKTTRLSKLCT